MSGSTPQYSDANKRPVRAKPDQFVRRDVETTFTLHGLNDDRGNLLRLDVCFEQAMQGIDAVLDADAVHRHRERQVIDAGRHRTEAALVGVDFTGQAHGHHGAAMEATGKCDHAWALGVRARDFNGVFDSFGAGGDEQRLFRCVARG